MLKDELVGTFRLVSLETRRSDGRVDQPMGEQPIGLFVFDPDGNYSVQLAGPDPIGAGTAGSYVATWGTYTVDEQAQTFTLTPEGALDRGLVGGAILRHVEFLDGTAVFHTPPQTLDGVEAITYITWRKVSPPRTADT